MMQDETIETAIQLYSGLTGKQLAEGFRLAGLPVPTAREWLERPYFYELPAIAAYRKEHLA